MEHMGEDDRKAIEHSLGFVALRGFMGAMALLVALRSNTGSYAQACGSKDVDYLQRLLPQAEACFGMSKLMP